VLVYSGVAELKTIKVLTIRIEWIFFTIHLLNIQELGVRLHLELNY